MIENDYTWLGIGTGALFVLAALVWAKRVNKTGEASPDSRASVDAPLTKMSMQEQIRQIALIEKDEFTSFYQPVIDCVLEYEQILSGKEIDSRYFETLYKALRKRRSAIFEYGSSEKDNQKRALWSFALFATLSLRHIVQRLSEYNFQLENRKLNPLLANTIVLARCHATKTNRLQGYAANLSNIHLIDKVLGASVIERFNHAGIYSFVVNSVTGFYLERVNPFYSIIEEVESHVGEFEIDEKSVFQQNLRNVLGMIERNTFSVNQIDSLVFEGISYLLVDRNFLWELFRMYAVSVSQPLGKKEFETQLKSVLNLGEEKDKAVTYTVSVEDTKLDNSIEKIGIKLSNVIALPYKSVPYYQHSDRRRIEKQVLKRDVVMSDDDRGLAKENDVASPNKKISPRSNARFKNDRTGTVGVKDLFSGQQ
jgi:hypothetical protein